MKAKDLIKDFVKNNSKILTKLIILCVASIILLVGIPLFLSMSIDALVDITNDIELESNKKILAYVGIFGFVLFTGAFYSVKYLFETTVNYFGSEITSHLRKNAYTALLRGEYYEIHTVETEQIENTLIQSCETIGNKYYANHLCRLVYLLVSYLAVEIFLAVLNPLFGLITFIVSLIYFGLSKFISVYQIKKTESISNFKKAQENEIIFNIKNLKNIKIRNGVSKEEQEYADIAENGKKLYNKRSVAEFLNNKFLIDISVFLLVFGLFAYTFFTTNFKNFTYGEGELIRNKITALISVSILTLLSLYSFKSLIDCYNEKVNISDAYKNINKILELKPESRGETISQLEEIHTLSFQNVCFDYPLGIEKNGRTGIEKISFELNKGESIGIYGFKNTGKTTILDLISKIIRPKYGSISINNCEINKLSTQYLRNNIAYVPQYFTIMDCTIEQNITYPMPLDEYRYNEALNKTLLKDLFNNLPKRDQENAKSINISRADIERIGLAYALYKDSPIIILDEATNELAKVSKDRETQIMDEFFKLKNKMLVVASTHPNIISKCDKVIVMNNGKIVEYGNRIDLEKDVRSNYSKIMFDANKNVF